MIESRYDWWSDDPSVGPRHSSLWKVVERLRKQQYTRNQRLLRYARMYSNAPLSGLTPTTYSQHSVALDKRLSLNLVKSCCDAYTAKMTKQTPRVTFLTSGGTWEQQQRAKHLESFVDSMSYEMRLDNEAPRIVLDSSVFGSGVLHIYPETTKKKTEIKCERVPPGELMTDDAESAYGSPLTFYRFKSIERKRCLAMWPDQASDLLNASAEDVVEGHRVGSFESLSDLVLVVEAWRLPVGGKPGRHVIAANNVTLLDEKWERDYAPFAVLHKQSPLMGYWGVGLAEELMGIQWEVNNLLLRIQKAINLMGMPHVFVQEGSMNVQKLTNEIGSVWRYTGTPPVIAPGQAMGPEVYQQLERLVGYAYQITGISQLSAASMKPAGLDSGKALRTLSNIETERFAVPFRAYQNWRLDVAKQIVDLAREIGEKNPNFGVKSTDRKSVTKLVWKDVHLDEDDYVIKLYPTNALETDPAGRIQQLTDMANAGWIDPKNTVRGLDYPDLQAFMSLDDASYLLVKDIVSDITERGIYQPPEPAMNLQEAVKIVQLSYLECRRQGLDEDRLQMLRDWLTDAQDLLKPPAPPPPPPGPTMPPGPPGAPPGPPGPDMGPPPPDGGLPLPTGAPNAPAGAPAPVPAAA